MPASVLIDSDLAWSSSAMNSPVAGPGLLGLTRLTRRRRLRHYRRGTNDACQNQYRTRMLEHVPH